MFLAESLQPLTCGRSLGDCLVAGMRFAELQASLLQAVDGGERITLAENAWVAPEVLQRLTEPTPPTLVIGDDVVATVSESASLWRLAWFDRTWLNRARASKSRYWARCTLRPLSRTARLTRRTNA